MKLLVLSDLHLECADLRLPDSTEFDVAILAGDIVNPGFGLSAWVRASPAAAGPPSSLSVATTSTTTASCNTRPRRRRGRTRTASPPLHLLDCDQVVVDGVRFLGYPVDRLRAAHRYPEAALRPQRGIAVAPRHGRLPRWVARRGSGVGRAAPRKLTPYDTLRLHRAQRAWLEAALAQPFDGSTVVVTHHGPHRASLAPRFAADWVSTAYLSELPMHFFEVPALWVHGHTHTSHDYCVGGCRVVCNPRGYATRGRATPENPAFDPARVLRLGNAPKGRAA
jgi:3',5'-cyclic AMP phosphodiesterase CpdA